MSKLRVNCFSMSVDGFGAGPEQLLQNPLGIGGEDLHRWIFPTRTLQKLLFNNDNGTEGIDDQFARRGMDNLGAWILGRNMFGPIRGPWSDNEWKGWWGDNPPYHVPVFVLTHHPREDLVMAGGTTFHFITGGIHNALQRAKASAQGKDIRIGGGAATIRQYLNAGLVDELHLAISPVALGRGKRLFEGVDLPALGYRCVEHVATEAATHVVFKKGQV